MKIALISDIHSNIYALNSVYSEINKYSIEKIFVMGDLVGYYYWPKEVVSLLMSDERIICIRGNHESILSEVINSVEAANHYRDKYGVGYDICLASLTAAELDWLTNLPEIFETNISGYSFFLRHGSLNSIDEYLYPDADLDLLVKNFSNSDFTIFGHTHYPLMHNIDNKYLINPGSVGQPRDSGGFASYAILNLENLSVSFKRKSFNVEEIIKFSKVMNPKLDYLWKVMSR